MSLLPSQRFMVFTASACAGFLAGCWSTEVREEKRSLSPEELKILKAKLNSRNQLASAVLEFCQLDEKPAVKVQCQTQCCDKGVIELRCKGARHTFCECKFQELLVSDMNMGLPLGKFKCICLEDIDFRIVRQVFRKMSPTERVYSKLSQKFEELNAAKFICEICLETVAVDGGITLDCDHRFCRNCLSDYIAQLVTEARVNDLKCPEWCTQDIAEAIIQALIPYALKQRLEEHRLRLLQGWENERKLTCLKCGTHFIIGAEFEDAAQCPNCNTQVRLENEEQKFDLKGLKQCPSCKEAILKESGCNFLRCQWGNCSTYFCYLCGVGLTPEEHYSHFPSGPYNDICVNQQ
mmetsp:Transcript_32945/g.57743  ORF Transcript_32945/g.57743 Transcript_32945/m.57743 type:complete len:350 (-) Transcript_32945:1148-2197(-)